MQRTKVRRIRKFTDYTLSSGNVFEDLELPDAEELNTKANLAIEIARLIRKRSLTQVEASQILEIDQPKISAIVRGRLEKFSVERLCELLVKLGCDVDIRIRDRRKTPGKLTVSVV
jgi:predicted XRE-type DNA-binding protein